MMAVTAVDRAGGALFSLTPSKMQTHLKPRDTRGMRALVKCLL